MATELTIEVHKEDNKYWGQVVEMPGCFGAGRTLDGLRESIEESIKMCAVDYPKLFKEAQLPSPHVVATQMTLSVGQ